MRKNLEKAYGKRVLATIFEEYEREKVIILIDERGSLLARKYPHAFEKAFLGTGEDRNGFVVTKLDGTTITVNTANGYVQTAGMPTYGLNQLKADASSTYTNGYIALFDPKVFPFLNQYFQNF